MGMPDGRVVELLTDGPSDGLPLVLHEGTPVGLTVYPATVEAAAVRGLRVVQIARPGYEGSTPWPGRRVADVAGDVADVLTALGAETFLAIGWSGGGPHSLACAALLPGRCLAAASIAGVAPYGAPGLDWTAGMGKENIQEFDAALAGEAALTAFINATAGQFRGLTGADVIESLGDLVAAADKAALTGEYGDHVAAALRSSLSSGIAGWRDDDLAFTRDWGFSLGWPAFPGTAEPELTMDTLLGPDQRPAPVAIWQGDQDRMVPYAHGQWLAENITRARAHLLPGEGHLTLTVTSMDRVLDDLLDLAGITG
jgi:pimeloyl-ACP methyl ester carboxylesterase